MSSRIEMRCPVLTSVKNGGNSVKRYLEKELKTLEKQMALARSNDDDARVSNLSNLIRLINLRLQSSGNVDYSELPNVMKQAANEIVEQAVKFNEGEISHFDPSNLAQRIYAVGYEIKTTSVDKNLFQNTVNEVYGIIDSAIEKAIESGNVQLADQLTSARGSISTELTKVNNTQLADVNVFQGINVPHLILEIESSKVKV